MMEHEKGISSHIQSASLFLLGILFLVFPIAFTTISTSPIILPKQILLSAIVFALFILQGAKMISDKSVKLKRTPFDIPIILLAISAFLSAVFAVNRIDALTEFIPYLLAILAFFLIINIVKDKDSILFLMASLMIGAVLISISAILSFFKIYLLPLSVTHTQTFNPLGSLIDQEIYLIIILSIGIYYLWRLINSKKGTDAPEATKDMPKYAGFALTSFIILLGITVTAYSLFKIEKPLILPLQTGFQTAFSELSLDTGRVAQGFLLGSGIGTYSTDFSRWKQPTFNQNQTLWNLTFFKSSNVILEILATTGVLGLCAFIFLMIKTLKEMRSGIQNKMFLSLLAILIISLLLPLSFVNQTLFFIILGLFAANQALMSKENNRFFDIELQIVALKKGFISMEIPQARSEKSLILPSIITSLILIGVGALGYYITMYTLSDLTFQKSLVAASQNNGALTYQLQIQAISNYENRDGFYRIFSQTNLSLANSLASQQPKGVTPSAKTQQDISTLIQQSINAARRATTIAPQTALNWQNLSSIYRGLIGFGENAENFAIVTAQQSINLDPNNPQEYISLGGIYYQLGQWDNAQNQFQIAVALKPDYANSHYNLGHVLEQKEDLPNAIAQYEIVKTLVANDKTSFDQISKEIAALQTKTNSKTPNSGSDKTLNVNTPSAQLPSRNPPVKIPAPSISPESSK